MSDSSLGLAIVAFVITLSIFVIGLLYFTKVFSVRGTALDQEQVAQVLQDKTDSISRLRRSALKKRNIQDIIDSKTTFKGLVNDYKNYKPGTDGVVDGYLSNVPKINYNFEK